MAAAAYYTLPIFITLFASVFLGDKISVAGWSAVALGFFGVLLVLKPQADDFNTYALLPIGSAVLYALSMLLTRSKCRDEHPLALSFALNVSFVAVGCVVTIGIGSAREVVLAATDNPFLFGAWIEMSTQQWLSMTLLASAVLVGSIYAAIAYQAGPSSIVGTFDFAYVGFAMLWGVVFFSEVPDLIMVAGIVLIVLAGLLVTRG